MISPARRVAFAVLLRVESGGYASDLLLSFASELAARDAGLAHEIVFGCLRFQAQLDYLIELWSGRNPARLDAEVRIALRMAVYQIRYLDRIPAHSAVHESVELVKRAGKRSAVAFTNAILRKANAAPIDWPTRPLALSTPEWLLARWDKQFGRETADRIARAFLQRPDLYIRNPPPNHGLEIEPSSVAGAFRLVSGDPKGLRLQDIGSQAIVPLLQLAPGDRFLDVCSAPGNKTAQAIEAGVQAIAADVHLHRLRAVESDLRVVLDATRPLPFARRFNKILVDAPCSGTGTLGRNPEIRWRIQPSDLLDLHERQIEILRNSLDVLEPGGQLAYSTCSLEPEENEAVVEQLCAERSLRVLNSLRRLPGVEPGDGFYAAVLTFKSP